jgi:SAM-dependent methyltransferase
MVEKGQSRYLPILSSPLALDILARGYHPRTLEQIYNNRPTDQSLIGRLADRVILDLPLHSGLRERFDATVGEIRAAAVLGLREREGEFRILIAPCGLGTEIRAVARSLREKRPELLCRMRFWGVDPDADGHLLPEARRLAAAAGLRAEFIREDLRRYREVDAVVEREGPFHLISLVGASQSRTVAEMAALVQTYVRALAPGGTLLLDRWLPTGKCRLSDGLGARVVCHDVREFQAALAENGLAIEREHPTGEGGNVLIVARKSA